MNSEHMRSQILALLPGLSRLTRDVLRAPGTVVDRLPAVAALAETEPEEAVHVMVEAARLYPKRPPKTFEAAARRLGVRGVCRALLRGAMPSLFEQRDADDAVDVEAHWWQANLRGACAEFLASQCQPDLLDSAYATAYLSQIGKIALDRCPELDSSSGTVFLHAGTGAFSLEMEQRRFGIDHALAGKWTLEAWGLPQAWAEAVWLQYHPAGSLDHTSYPVALAELIGLAGRLVAAQFTGQQENLIEAAAPTAERLGLSLAALRVAAYTDFERFAPEVEPIETPVDAALGAPPIFDPAELLARLEWAEAITTLYEATADVTSETAVLNEIVGALRTCVPCEAGLCVLTGPQGAATAGVIWRGGEAPSPIPVTTRDGSGQTSAALRRLLESFEGASEWRTHDGAGMLALPLSENGRVYGQFVLEVADHASDGRNLSRLADLVRACAHILRRLESTRLNARRQEETGSAILQQEQVHRRAMRKARLDSVSRMAAGAAHEINNPLAVISGRAQLLLSRAADPDQVQALETIVQQSRRVSRVITDLMQFARPEAPKFAPLSLSQILHQAHLTQADRLKEAGIRVVEDYAAGLPLVEADRLQMMQVFTHLITNAIQAMPDGGLLTLRVKAGMHTPSVVVQIIDSGSGIMPEHMDRVFEPFFSGRPMGQAGTGLGLSVAHSIVERHLGTINLQSEMGEGCTCTLRFPASAVAEVSPAHFTLPASTSTAREGSPFTPPPFAPRGTSTATPATTRGRIIICEPNEDAREVMQRTLEGRGFSAVGAHDGLEALAQLFTAHADILLCDLHESALDGLPLLKQVRERFPGLAIVAFTAHITSELSSDPLRPLADACVQKPFHLETLFASLDACLVPVRRAAQ